MLSLKASLHLQGYFPDLTALVLRRPSSFQPWLVQDIQEKDVSKKEPREKLKLLSIGIVADTETEYTGPSGLLPDLGILPKLTHLQISLPDVPFIPEGHLVSTKFVDLKLAYSEPFGREVSEEIKENQVR